MDSTLFCLKRKKLCLTFCDPMDCSPPGSSVHEFPRQEYWSGLPFPSAGDLPDSGIKPAFPASPALSGRFFTTEPPGKPCFPSGQNLEKCVLAGVLISFKSSTLHCPMYSQSRKSDRKVGYPLRGNHQLKSCKNILWKKQLLEIPGGWMSEGLSSHPTSSPPRLAHQTALLSTIVSFWALICKSVPWEFHDKIHSAQLCQGHSLLYLL